MENIQSPKWDILMKKMNYVFKKYTEKLCFKNYMIFYIILQKYCIVFLRNFVFSCKTFALFRQNIKFPPVILRLLEKKTNNKIKTNQKKTFAFSRKIILNNKLDLKFH